MTNELPPPPGLVVRQNLPQVFEYCTTKDRDELIHLMDPSYSNQQFKLNFPFLKTPAGIDMDGDTTKFWVEIHHVLDHDVRVTSQWTSRHIPSFLAYLMDKGLPPIGVTREYLEAQLALLTPHAPAGKSPGGPRYNSRAVGDAQNSLVRYILSNLEYEAFTKMDWMSVKAGFDHTCAYCGTTRQLVMDHAVPISIEALGEHRLGNLVPACSTCNSSQKKGQKRYDDYLLTSSDQPDAHGRTIAIEAHMTQHGHTPLAAPSSATFPTRLSRLDTETADAVRDILRDARAQTAAIAKTAITEINNLIGAAEAP